MLQVVEAACPLDTALQAERARLVRLCARLTNDTDVAEDLAQETLVEAWRNWHTLRDVEKRSQWLSGIARNVCLRWGQKQGRDAGRRAATRYASDRGTSSLVDQQPDDFDVEVELDRQALVELLDRALALLPPDTRGILIARYVHDAPHAEIAARLGMSEGAIAMRLQRGKLALRRILLTDLKDEAIAYGLTDGVAVEWSETRIWCPICGQRRLQGYFSHARNIMTVQCPACRVEPGTTHAYADAAWMFGAAKGYERALHNLLGWADGHFRRALNRRTAPCLGCGHTIPLHMHLPENLFPPSHDLRGIHLRCSTCGSTCDYSLRGLVLALPEGRRFWREHRRIRAQSEQEIEAAGRPAILTRFESLRGSARLDVLSARDTYEVLALHRYP